MKPKSTLQTLVAVLAVTLSGPAIPTRSAAAERTEHKELPAIDAGTLTFKAFAGSIEIKTHNQSSVIYDATLKPSDGWFGNRTQSLDDVVFNYEEANGSVKISVGWKDGRAPRNVNLNARHVLLVPARYNLDLRTGGGGITAEGVTGTVAADTSGGSVRIGNVNGDVKAHTSGGSITIGDVKGDAEVKTSGGNIQVGNVQGNVSAHTSGGSVTAKLAGQITEPLDLSTSGGSVQLTIPRDFKADLDARTSGGKVHCELPVEGATKRGSITGKLNGGGPKVTLHTSGGSIKVAAN